MDVITWFVYGVQVLGQVYSEDTHLSQSVHIKNRALELAMNTTLACHICAHVGRFRLGLNMFIQITFHSFITSELALEACCKAALPGCLSWPSRCSCICWVGLISSRPPRAGNASHTRHACETRRTAVTLSLRELLCLLIDCALDGSLA